MNNQKVFKTILFHKTYNSLDELANYMTASQ